MRGDGAILMNFLSIPMTTPFLQKIGLAFCAERGVRYGGNPEEKEKERLRNEKIILSDPIWNLISKNFQNKRITYLKNSPNVLPQMAGIFLKGNFKKTDIFALGRINRKKASIYRNKTYEHFRNNKLDNNTIFIINSRETIW